MNCKGGKREETSGDAMIIVGALEQIAQEMMLPGKTVARGGERVSKWDKEVEDR